MKRKLIIVVLIAVLIGAYTWLSTTVWGIGQEIWISTPIYKVADQFTDLKNWKNWEPDLLNNRDAGFRYSDSTSAPHGRLWNGKQQYTIVSVSPASVVVKEESDGRIQYHSLTAIPDSFGMATRVHWTESLSIVDWLKNRSDDAIQIKTGLNNLKSFIEDPVKQYGFQIKVKSVSDTLIMIKGITVPNRNKFQALSKLYQDIREYARQNNVPVKGPEMANFHPQGDDSIHIMAGIPVAGKAPVKNGIAFLEMPSGGKMLIGFYEGPYYSLPNLYHAMEKYIIDKNLRKISSEYEKYVNSPAPANDSMRITLELHYPIL